MWNKLAGCIVLASALTAPVSAQDWSKASPGGGGAFLTADLAADGTVLVGSDLSGLYRFSGAGSWTRIGRKDGLDATSVEVVRWRPGQSTIALAGTRNGLFRTPSGSFPEVWAKVNTFGSEVVTAIGWLGNTVYAASGGDGSTAPTIRWSTDGNGEIWSNPVSPTSDLIGLRIVKLAVDPFSANTIWLLSGHDRLVAGLKELWKGTNSGGNWTWAKKSGTLHAIDFGLSPSTAGIVIMTTSDQGPTGGNDDKGSVRVSRDGGDNWTEVTSGMGLDPDATGAVWFDAASVAYVINVQADACGSPAPAWSGKFKGTTTDDWQNHSWTKVDDGVDCVLDRGGDWQVVLERYRQRRAYRIQRYRQRYRRTLLRWALRPRPVADNRLRCELAERQPDPGRLERLWRERHGNRGRRELCHDRDHGRVEQGRQLQHI